MTGIPVAGGELVGLDYMNEVSRAHWRKSSPATINNIATAAALASFTIDANAMGGNRMLRLTTLGDALNNSGSTQGSLRLQLLLGAATLFDTGSQPASWAASATRVGWHFTAEIMNLGATNSQAARCLFHSAEPVGGAFTVGEGYMNAFGSGGGNPPFMGWAFNTAAVDTTVANSLVLNVILGAAHPSLECKLFGATVEVI